MKTTATLQAEIAAVAAQALASVARAPDPVIPDRRAPERPLDGADRRFAEQPRPEAVDPQLRVRRLFDQAGPLAGAPTASQALELKDIVLDPLQFIKAIRPLVLDREGLLAHGVLPVHVSDLDGTLWKHAVADRLVYGKLCPARLLKPVIRDQLSALMDEMRRAMPRGEPPLADDLRPSGLDEPDRGVNADVLRVKAAFQQVRGQMSPEQLGYWSRQIYAVTSWALAGFSVPEIQAFVRDSIREQGLKGNAFHGARAKLLALRRLGVPTTLFTASNTVLAQAAVDEIFGRSPRLLVRGTDTRIDADGRLTGELIDGGLCYRENKLAKVKAYLAELVERDYPGLRGRECRPLLASGDSPTKTDAQMMEHGLLACADEPGTARDASLALERARATGRYFVIDYARTKGGEPADKFARG